MKTEFTPGPWHAYQTHPTEYPEFWWIGLSIGDGLRNGICSEYLSMSGVCSANDAHLIAAAPELYEALESMLSEFNEQIPGVVHDELAVIHKARQALAKARGEA